MTASDLLLAVPCPTPSQTRSNTGAVVTAEACTRATNLRVGPGRACGVGAARVHVERRIGHVVLDELARRHPGEANDLVGIAEVAVLRGDTEPA